jgi:ubiquinone/menaquinone biosynthesis C-methylase UbiE
LGEIMTRVPSDGDEVAAAYDEWAAVYDSERNLTRDLDAAVLRRQSFDLTGANVLELGCGTGKNTEWLARRARSVLAMDFSRGMLDVARKRIGSDSVHFVEHDIRLPWPAQSAAYDAVVENLTLEHVEDLRPIFREAARVLQPGGWLFVCELHPFRQLSGAAAHFRNPASGGSTEVPTYLHDVSEFLRSGLAARLRLVAADDWRDEGAMPTTVPRLFSTLWKKENE